MSSRLTSWETTTEQERDDAVRGAVELETVEMTSEKRQAD